MARPREFDTSEVLDKAMHVFWAKGYKATSLQDLLENMEISKSSFYETFGNKHDLYLLAIEAYIKCTTQLMLNRLLLGGPFLKALDDILQSIIDTTLANDERRGCMLANSAVELSAHDRESEQLVAAAMKRVEDAFYKAIARAQKDGEIAASNNARALARFVVCNLNGLMVISKVNPDRATLMDIKKTLLAAIR